MDQGRREVHGRDLKKTKVAIINDNTGYGVLSRETVTKFLAARDLKPVYTATVDPNKPDVTDELLKAKEAGADVITEWSNATGFVARLVNARGEQNWNVPIVGHPTILQEQVAKLLTQTRYWDNVYGLGYAHEIVDAQGKLPANVQAFMDKHKDTIGPYMAAGLPAFLQGHAAVTIYADGTDQGRRSRSVQGQGGVGIDSPSSTRHTVRSSIPPPITTASRTTASSWSTPTRNCPMAVTRR